MSQYEQSQPFSFFGYPESYSGGYDVAQPQAAAPVTRYEEIMAQPAMGGGGGRGMPADEGGTFTEPTSEQAYNVSTLGRNLRYVSPLFGGLASMYGNYLASQVNPNYSNEGRNYPAPTGGFLSSEAAPSASTGTLSFAPPTEAQYGAYLAQQQADAAGREYGTGAVPPTMTQNQFAAQYAAYGAGQQPAASTGGFTPYSGTQNAVRSYDAMGREISPNQAALSGASVVVSDARSAAEAQARADAAAQDARVAAFDASRESTRSGGGGGMGGDGGGGVATGGNNGDASGGGDRGTRGGFAQGGHVSMMHLQGPNPMGPDDGYAALKDGEFVINDKAVKKYGIELMQAINSGKISKGKLRGLLEM